MKTKKGFTLLELLIVTAIIGTLSLCSILGLKSSLEQKNMNNTANQIVSDLNYLRTLAMSTDQDCSLDFTATGYTQIQGNTFPPSVSLQRQIYPNNLRGSLVRLGFKPNGTPKYSGTITLTSKGAKISRISLAAVTGKITVKLSNS